MPDAASYVRSGSDAIWNTWMLLISMLILSSLSLGVRIVLPSLTWSIVAFAALGQEVGRLVLRKEHRMSHWFLILVVL